MTLDYLFEFLEQLKKDHPNIGSCEILYYDLKKGYTFEIYPELNLEHNDELLEPGDFEELSDSEKLNVSKKIVFYPEEPQ